MAKVSMKLFTDLLYDEYKHKNIATTVKNNPVYNVAPLVKLTKEQNYILTEGDGQTEDQYKQYLEKQRPQSPRKRHGRKE